MRCTSPASRRKGAFSSGNQSYHRHPGQCLVLNICRFCGKIKLHKATVFLDYPSKNQEKQWPREIYLAVPAVLAGKSTSLGNLKAPETKYLP